MDMKSYLTPEEFHHRKIKFVSLRHQIPLRLWAISANVGAAAAALLAARYYSVKCSKVDLENCQFQKKVPQKLWFSLLRWVIRSCLRSNVNKKKTTFFLSADRWTKTTLAVQSLISWKLSRFLATPGVDGVQDFYDLDSLKQQNNNFQTPRANATSWTPRTKTLGRSEGRHAPVPALTNTAPHTVKDELS